MDAEPQRFRFRETNRLITANFGRVGRMLEVGCGEGHQSEELLQVCDELVGIDVSPRAVRRANARCPEATFGVGDIFDCDLLPTRERFDLVVGCEVLYYMSDVAAALERFSTLGRACLVSYYEDPSDRLDPDVLSISGIEWEMVRYKESAWKVAWWRNPV